MNKRLFLLSGTAVAAAQVLPGCSTTSGSTTSDAASKRAKIDASVDNALANLYPQASGSREMVAKARGMLVFPSVITAGLGVGGSYGEGALRVGGKSTGYYSTAGGSFGLIAGAESKALYILFMNDEALAKFMSSKGWTAGVDANVTVAKTSAEANVNTATMQAPVVAYALSNGGLIANVTLDGTKVTKLDL
jgi:lipid-binding SYLF domain-containing protein